ncbi:sensor histidine kinase [Mucilaginibacter sp. X4EP1]|uniref:sensor histidine kinase n=1 Tax=Mucilaginibacter sp. X4EP1 TaxID=2723092 RepID=UPI00216A6C1A|nr:sensor histidine kinase [Mucilaginibacter sp. X4EP1]MCS3813456.1 two-component sensor histidine kinase [Mucilaginibacter sp. X4EP1]
MFFLNGIPYIHAQKTPGYPASEMKPSFQRLLLDLSTTYFTVVKENQVDLDSSLIHVSHSLSLSRLPVVADGIDDKEVLNNAQWVDQRNPWIGQQQLHAATGQKHAELLTLLGAYFAFEPLNDSSAIKKSAYFLNQGIKESGKLNNAPLKLAGERLLGKLSLKNYDFVKADKLFDEVKNGYLNAGDQLEAATTCSWWGLYAPVTPASSPPRIKHIEMALDLYKSIDDKESQVNALINDSYIHVLLFDFADAEKLEKQALDLAQQTGFPYTHYITGALLAITTFQGKFGEPLNYGIESAKQAEMLRDSIGLPHFYGSVGQIYSKENDDTKVPVIWYTKAINCFLSQHESCYFVLNDIVNNLVDCGRKGDALQMINRVVSRVPPKTDKDKIEYDLAMESYYISNKSWAVALRSINNADSIAKYLEKHGGYFGKKFLIGDFASFYYKIGNYKKAKIYYKQYLNTPSVHGKILYNEMIAWHVLIEIDSTEGNKDAELKDYAKYMDLVNQNYIISKTRQAEELQVKYATADRINQIKVLDQKAKLEQENLKQANRVKDITIGGIILLVIIAVLLYRQTRMKQKTNNIINRKNELMQQLLEDKELLLEEKEWLVKEIHHRVKNNLHTIICLLESQALYLDNDALKAIETSRHRIYAMSLIHQKLYQSDDIKVIDIKLYLIEFVQYLTEGFGSPENIRVTLHAEHINLGAAQAIPIGLIINEAVNNSFKYAFPNQREGKIEITLQKNGDEIYLSVIDDGVGFKHDTDLQADSLGLELIKGLTLDLKGNLDFNTNNGTKILIRFAIDLVSMPLEAEYDGIA